MSEKIPEDLRGELPDVVCEDCAEPLDAAGNCANCNEPCLSDGTPLFPQRRLTRQERLQEMADAGCDTWEDYRGER